MNRARYYRDLLTQGARIEAFRRAITAVVRRGDHVLDVGTGLGTFAMFAADCGARVWAVDGDPIVHVARAIGRENGYDDRITWIRGWIPEIRLPEPIDVVIFEDFAPRLLEERVFRILAALHDGYVAPDARFIPAVGRTYAAPVGAPALRSMVAPFGDGGSAYGVRWGASRSYVANDPMPVEIAPDWLMAPPAQLGEMRLDRRPEATGMNGRATWTLPRDATVDGLAYWCDLDLSSGVVLSNAPGATPGSWGHLFLPVDPPLPVRAGEVLETEISTESSPAGEPGWLKWEVVGARERRWGHEFAAVPASLEDILLASPDGVPRLTKDGLLMREVLGLTDGNRTEGEIAQDLRDAYPELTPADAIRAVREALTGRATVPPPFAEGK